MQPARYDPSQTYAWNYDHAPDPVPADEPPVPGSWTYCGRPVGSPLAIAAGPLLNGRWCLYYAGLGFDVVTYKTVRSGLRPCYADAQPASRSARMLSTTATKHCRPRPNSKGAGRCRSACRRNRRTCGGATWLRRAAGCRHTSC